jgi:murein L,D-transpeptidase YafK
VLRSYHVSLGPHPAGQKEAAGDGRTPEGSYVIDWRNIRSQYHVALHISYPDRSDVKRSIVEGGKPGGAIMIHGEPNYLTNEGRKWLKPDWTAGCIALKNSEVDEVWRLVDDGTPIVIYP